MTYSSTTAPWFAYTRPKPRAHMRLFCFPYAGGGASIFRPWVNAAPDDIDVVPIVLPGRERRFKEPAFTQLAPLIDALAQALTPCMQLPYAFFGHSMGALTSFELVRQLRRSGAGAPTHLFLSGFHAPQLPDASPPIHALPTKEFLEAIRAMNGTPDEVFQHAELLQLMEPILRADFKLYEEYTYVAEPPLACPISAWSGDQDPQAAPEHMQPWCDQTSAAFVLRTRPGDHFFLHAAWSTMLRDITHDLGLLP